MDRPKPYGNNKKNDTSVVESFWHDKGLIYRINE